MNIPQRYRNLTGLSEKLQRISSVAIGLSLALIAVLMFTATALYNINSLVKNSESIAVAMAYNLAPSLEFNDKRVAKEVLGSLASIAYIEQAIVVNNRGDIFSNYDADSHEEHNTESFSSEPVAWSINHVNLTRPVSRNDTRLGYLFIRVGLHAYYESMGWLLLAAVLVTTIALMLGRHFVARFNRPVISSLSELASTMARITEDHNYDVRRGSYNIAEIEQLSENFHGMIRNLRERDKQLAEYRNHLETEVENRTHELSFARDVAERASNAKSEFLSSMSHELRTPLNAIIGFSQILQWDESLNEESMQSVEEILNAGNHLLTLINEVLDLSRIESGNLELSIEAVDIQQVITESVSLVSQMANKNSISLSYELLTSNIISADYTRLKQVILNLLSNAVKYNHKGGSVKLLAESVNNDSVVRFSVIDTGKGISPDKIDELFVPFNRLGEEYSSIEGTGIGLAITKRIVDMMGGSIGVSSEQGKGSTFWVEMPVEMVMDDGAEQGQTLVEHEQQPVSLDIVNDCVVLYIEDNPVNISLVKKIFEKRYGLEILSASTPGSGIEMVQEHKPDMVLLDINLPGLDGYAVLDVFSKMGSMKDVPVIAISANAMHEDIKRGKKSGFVEYITKPIEVNGFIAVIDEYLKCIQDRAAVKAGN